MPLYRPPEPSRAVRVAAGSAASAPEPRIRRESELSDNLTLARRGIIIESELAFAPASVTRGSTTKGDYSISDVDEVGSDGTVRTRRVVIADVGQVSNYVVGSPGAIRTDTAQTATSGPTIESARPLGGFVESGFDAGTPFALGATQTDSELLNVALAAHAANVAQVQYDAALGYGQPVYEAPPTSNPDPHASGQPDHHDPTPQPDPSGQNYYGLGVPEPDPYTGGSFGF